MWKTIFFQDYINIKREADCDRASICLLFRLFTFSLALIEAYELF